MGRAVESVLGEPFFMRACDAAAERGVRRRMGESAAPLVLRPPMRWSKALQSALARLGNLEERV
jgi:hypothetical protein